MTMARKSSSEGLPSRCSSAAMPSSVAVSRPTVSGARSGCDRTAMRPDIEAAVEDTITGNRVRSRTGGAGDARRALCASEPELTQGPGRAL
jgi:hypothetical protein